MNIFCKEGIFFGQKTICKFDIDTLNVNYILEHSLFYDNEDMDSAFVGIRHQEITVMCLVGWSASYHSVARSKQTTPWDDQFQAGLACST